MQALSGDIPGVNPEFREGVSPAHNPQASTLQISCYGSAEGHGEGVGGVGWDRVADAEEAGDHSCNLLLGSAAVSGRRRLDLLGAVLVDGHAVGAAGDDRGAARLSELEGGGGVFREEDFFHRGFRGPMEKDQVGELAMDPEESVGERRLAFEPDHAPRDGRDGVPPDVDDPVSGPQRSRIDPDDPPQPNASMSSSEMSKFAQTFWTSSDSSRAFIILSIVSAGFP